MSVEQHLRSTFDRYAERTPEPGGVLDGVRARYRRSGRRRRVLGAVACAAFAIAVPTVIEVREPTSIGTGFAEGVGSFELLPPRGSLAGDADFLDAVLRVPWSMGSGGDAALDPPLDARHVVFAGDVPGGRWAYVVAQVDDAWTGTWLIGATGAAAARLQPVSEGTPVERWNGFVGFEDPAGSLVVLAEPGDVVEVSERTEVGADGIPRRTYRPVSTSDGLAVVELDDRTVLSFQVRVRHQDSYGPLSLNTAIALDPYAAWDDHGLAAGEIGSADPAVLRDLLVSVTEPLGLAPADVSFSVVWDGPVDVTGIDAAAVLAEVRLPSGAVVVAGRWAAGATGEEAWVSANAALEILPAGTARPALVALHCEISVDPAGQEVSSRLLVVDRTSTATAVHVMSGSEVVAEAPLVDGSVTIALPAGAERVVSLDSAGEVVADAAIGSTTDLWLLDSTG